MTRRRLRTPCARRATDDGTERSYESPSAAATDEDMEQRVRSAIRDAYEALQVKGEDEGAEDLSEIELVSELIH